MRAGVAFDAGAGRLALEGLSERVVRFSARVAYRDAAGQRRALEIGGGGGLSPAPLPDRGSASDGGFAFDGAGLRVELRWTADAEGGLRLDLTLVPTAGPILLDAVIPMDLGPELPIGAPLERCRFFQHGFHSWTPCRSLPATAPPQYPRNRSFTLMNHYPDSPLWGRRDGLVSNQLALLQAGAGDALLAAFLRQEQGLGELFLRNHGAPALIAHLDHGGARLERGEALACDPLYLARGPGLAMLDRFARLAAEAASVPPPALAPRSPAGWCSWYELYTGVREEDMRGNAATIAARPELGLTLVQLDDGYQAALGDWREVNRKFPSGLAAVASEIRRRGLGAGLWTAPLLCSKRSRLAREHPDYLLRDERGRAVSCGFNPMWRESVVALDLTHPGAADWLHETFAALAEDGFDYFKVDFMFAGLRHGRRHDPRVSPVAAYRRAMAILRGAIGPRRFLLGCGAPIGASLGYVDAMRVSEDVKEDWAPGALLGWLGAGCGVPSASGAIRNTMTRSFLHRRFWLNDPDCLLVRRDRSRLTLAEVQSLATALGMSGGMMFLSDDLTALDADRLELARAVLPPSALGAAAPDLLERDAPALYEVEQATQAEGGGRRLCAVFRWEDEDGEAALPAALCEGGRYLYEFWRDAALPAGARSVGIARHGVAAVLATPRGEEPAVIGSSLHLMALVDGRIAGRFEAERGELVVRGRELAREHGSLWVAMPAGWELDRGALPAEVSEATRWAEGVRVVMRAKAPWELRLRFRERGR